MTGIYSSKKYSRLLQQAANTQRNQELQSNSEKFSEIAKKLSEKILNTSSVIIIIGIVACLVTMVIVLCIYILYYQKKLKNKITKATNAEVRKQKQDELEQERENIKQIIEQTRAMKELNQELTQNQRRANSKFHTQNNFFTAADRENMLDRTLNSDDLADGEVNRSQDIGVASTQVVSKK